LDNLKGKDHCENSRGWEDNISMDLVEIGGGANWVYLAQDSENGNEPSGSINKYLPKKKSAMWN
jgi:hypothetical protein